jgi:hypothetical protein
MSFDAGDVGKTYQLEIKVYGEDKTTDQLPSGDSVGDDLLYTFQWSKPLPLSPIVAYKSIAVTAAGSVNFKETRSVDVAKLDEDADSWTVIQGTTFPLRRQDEVYARITLSASPVTVKTPTVIANPGE